MNSDEVSVSGYRWSIRPECIGGGSIEVNEGQKTLLIFGDAEDCDRADHEYTKELIE